MSVSALDRENNLPEVVGAPDPTTSTSQDEARYPYASYPQVSHHDGPEVVTAPTPAIVCDASPVENKEWTVVETDEDRAWRGLLMGKKAGVGCCGLRVRKRWVVLLVVILVLVLAVGLGVGLGLELKKGEDGVGEEEGAPNDGADDAPAQIPVLESSSLVALNWTDETFATRQSVFYQDGSGSLRVSHGQTDVENWSVVNISDVLVPLQGTSMTLRPKEGTPLSACVRDSSPYALEANPSGFQLNLYYINQANVVIEAFSSDASLETWSVGSLTLEGYEVVPGSSIACHWDKFWEDPYELSFVYQPARDGSSVVQVVAELSEDSPASWSERAVVSEAQEEVMRFATTFAPDGRDVPDWEGRSRDQGLNNLRFYSSYADRVWERSPYPTKDNWTSLSPVEIRPQQTATDLQMSSITYPAYGRLQWAVAALDPGRDIQMSEWRSISPGGDDWLWDNGVVALRDAPDVEAPRAFAMAYDMRGYVLAGGEIFQFEIDRLDPTQWGFMGKVKTRG